MHTLSCYPVAAYGSDAQRKKLLPDMLGGELLGAYCLSEPQGGSDAAALATRAVRDGDEYRGHRHQGLDHPRRRGRLLQRLLPHRRARSASGISCLLADASTPGIVPQPREQTMGLRSSPVAQIVFDDARSCRPTG